MATRRKQRKSYQQQQLPPLPLTLDEPINVDQTIKKRTLDSNDHDYNNNKPTRTE